MLLFRRMGVARGVQHAAKEGPTGVVEEEGLGGPFSQEELVSWETELGCGRINLNPKESCRALCFVRSEG